MTATSIAAHPIRRTRRAVRIVAWLSIGLVVVLVVVYLAIGAVAADRLTRPARRFVAADAPSSAGIAYDAVVFSSRDGEAQIAGWFLPSTSNDQVVIMVHGLNASRTAGFGGHFQELATALHNAGLAVLAIDLRGHGESSDGRFSFGLEERQDVLGAVDWLEAQGFRPGTIGVLGVSLGAASSIGATAEEPAIGALVTDSAFADIAPLLKARWRKESGLPQILLPSARLMIRVMYGYDIMSSRPVAEIGAVAPRPLLMIHCGNDVEVPISQMEQLRAAAPAAEVWVIPECPHSEGYLIVPAEYEEKVIEFFKTDLK
jgi:pimeloyl-ACP methyl ester carboxylesterase